MANSASSFGGCLIARLRVASDKIKLPAHESNDEKSIRAAGAEGDKNKAGGDRKHNELPVLAVEAKKEKALDQKVQRLPPPMFCGKIGGPVSKYIILIFLRTT
jgi:hypothetical protein